MTDLETRLEQIRLCAPLLPPPGDRVVDQLVRALVEAVGSLSCDQDMHARNRISECDRCETERKILAILDGRETPNV